MNWRRQSIGVAGEIIDATFRVREADESDIKWIAGSQEKEYLKSAVPLGILMEWYKAFPNGFFIIVDNMNRPIGHIDILPIKNSILNKYKEGTIIETDIRADCLYTPSEIGIITDIYIESLIIDPDNQRSKPVALRALMGSFPDIISRIGRVNKLERISAVAATRDGERILEHLAFRMISDSSERKDGHKMYEAKFKSFYKRIMKTYIREGNGLAATLL